MKPYFFSIIILGLVLLTVPVAAQNTYDDLPYRNEVKEVDGVQMQTYYYSNGKKRAEGPLVNGKRDGAWKIYYSNGSVEREGKYIQNALDGKWTLYDSTNRSMSYIEAETNDKGEFDGKYVRKGRDGKTLVECSFAAGKLDGSYSSWYENGQRKVQCNYVNGEYDGSYATWYESGARNVECTYKNGLRDGMYIRWYDNGQIDVEGKYIKGKAVGTWKFGYEDGRFERGSLAAGNNDSVNKAGRWDEYSSDGNKTGYHTCKYMPEMQTSRLEGEYETRYPSGKVHWKGVRSWVKTAKQTEYYENGKKKKEGFWIRVNDKDIANGILTFWDESGRKTEESEFRDGEKVRVIWTPEIEAGKKWAFKSQSEFINWITRGRWIGPGNLDYTRWVMDFTNGALSRYHVMARNMNVMDSYRDNWVICEISGNKCKIIVDKSNRLHEQRFLCNSGIAIWITRMGANSLKYGLRDYVRQ